MSSAKLALACALAAFALVLSACGTIHKPMAGSGSATVTTSGARGQVDDPRQKHLGCLAGLHLPVAERGKTDIVIGTPPDQVTATFTPTPGAAQEEQIGGHVEGAEVIGSALVYPGSASDSELKSIEDCLAQGVKG
jgi:uncharacterized protein YceK